MCRFVCAHPLIMPIDIFVFDSTTFFPCVFFRSLRNMSCVQNDQTTDTNVESHRHILESRSSTKKNTNGWKKEVRRFFSIWFGLSTEDSFVLIQDFLPSKSRTMGTISYIERAAKSTHRERVIQTNELKYLAFETYCFCPPSPPPPSTNMTHEKQAKGDDIV